MAVRKIQIGPRNNPDLHERMKKIAAEKGISVNEAYAEAAEEFVGKPERLTPEQEAQLIAMYLAKEMEKR